MSPPASHTLEVPGAQLVYEVQGAGPALMFVGHPMGAAGFALIASSLAESYKVITFDPRGFARSTIDDPDQDADPDLLADDARRVLEAAVGDVPAYVFGSSGGAVTGLALVARFPGHVRTLVAHEPPLALLLPEAEEARTGMHEIYDTFYDSGISAAWRRFASFVGFTIDSGQDQPSDPQPPSAAEVAMSERFFGHGLLPIALYQPDFSALAAAPTRLIIAAGAASKGEFPHRTALALADRLDTNLIEFPGGHTGFESQPDECVVVLERALA